MSLLLDSLQRVKTKQRVFAAPRPSTPPTYSTESFPHPLGEDTSPPMTGQGIVVAPGVADAVISDDLLARPVGQLEVAAAPMTAPGIVFSAADAGPEMTDDTLVRQVRQLASNILATYPGADSLGLAFVTLHWPSEAPRFLQEFARAFAKCAGAEVLLVNDVREGPWQSWKQRFRYAILQSEGGSNEVKLLSGADGVYLTIALGRTPRRRVNDSIALLRAAGAPIRGSVLIGQPHKIA
jgi:hypothetical protein